MDTARKLMILGEYGNVKIEAVETVEGDFETTFYEYAIFFEDDLLTDLSDEDVNKYDQDGIAGFLDESYVYISQSLDIAVQEMFAEYYETILESNL